MLPVAQRCSAFIRWLRYVDRRIDIIVFVHSDYYTLLSMRKSLLCVQFRPVRLSCTHCTDCLTVFTCTQVAEFFLFSGLMFLTTFAFGIMSLFYTYVTPRSVDDQDSRRRNPQTATVAPAVNWNKRNRLAGLWQRRRQVVAVITH